MVFRQLWRAPDVVLHSQCKAPVGLHWGQADERTDNHMAVPARPQGAGESGAMIMSFVRPFSCCFRFFYYTCNGLVFPEPSATEMLLPGSFAVTRCPCRLHERNKTCPFSAFIDKGPSIAVCHFETHIAYNLSEQANKNVSKSKTVC